MNALKHLVAVLLAIPAVCFADTGTQPIPRNCPLKQLGSVDLTIDGEILVPATVDGHAGFMVLNVGDGGTFLWDSFVQNAGLHKRQVLPITFQSNLINTAARVKNIVVGSMGFGRGSFYVSPPVWVKPADQFGMPVIGALGMDVLASVDFELDVAHRKLNVFSHEHCTGHVVYWTDKAAALPLHRDQLGNIYIDLVLDGRKLEAMLVMGRETTGLRKDVAKRLYGFDTGPAGSPDRYIAMSMTTPGLTAYNVRVSLETPSRLDRGCTLTTAAGVASFRRDCTGVYPLEIGRNVLRSLRLYFATKEKVLYVTAADAS